MKRLFFIFLAILIFANCKAQKISRTYNSATIGSQLWMSEYLDVTTFNNGDTIRQAINLSEWTDALINETPAWCFSNFDSTSRVKIYNFYAIRDKRQIAPKGWKIPTEEELDILKRKLSVYAGSPKTTPYLSLISTKEDGTNETGFNLTKATLMADFRALASRNNNGKFEITPMVCFWNLSEIVPDEKLAEQMEFYKKNEYLISPKIKPFKQVFKVVRFSKWGEDVDIYNLSFPPSYFAFMGAPIRCIGSIYDIQLPNGDIQKNGKWGMIDVITGKVDIPIKYDFFSSNWYYHKAFGKKVRDVNLNKKYGIIDLEGFELIKPIYDTIFYTPWRDETEIYLSKNGIEKIYNSPKDINENDFIQSTKESNKLETNNKLSPTSNKNNYFRIGNIDVFPTDLEVGNYYHARQIISYLGDGWRLPTESELHLMYENQNKIGGLKTIATRAFETNFYARSYLGGSFDDDYCELYTEKILASKGNTFRRNWNRNSARDFYFYVRPVRGSTVIKPTNSNESYISKMARAYTELLKLAKDYGVTIDNKPFGSSSGNTTSNSSYSKPSSSNTSSKHTFQVTITWNNPNCGSCAFPRPSAQNGILDYFYERSGSYHVKPICPICGKKQYNTIDGFTDNIGTSNQGSKVVTITCN